MRAGEHDFLDSNGYFSSVCSNVLNSVKKLVIEANGPFEVLNESVTKALFLLGSWNRDSLVLIY